MGLAFTSGSESLMYIGLGIGVIFLVLMGGMHHIFVAIVTLGMLYFGYSAYKTGNDQIMLFALLGAGIVFVIFVLHGKEEAGGEQGGMDAYGMGGLGLPMGY
jgi:hypothetical protein